MKDKHDLIHKAVGWMLREIGKRDEKILTRYLDVNAHKMPRTMLRYEIGRLPERKRKYYMSKKGSVLNLATLDLHRQLAQRSHITRPCTVLLRKM